MAETRETGAVDLFRVLAALLVITIHTAPLSSFDADLDFFLTRVLARTAVPFFFLASGFFLLPGLQTARLKKFLKKALLLYGAATFVYLPVNLYAGNFNGFGPWDYLRELFMDGTFYHLWYLPASLLGAAIAFGLLKKLGDRGAVFLTALLYLLGLLGDSYYGFAAALPPVKAFYDGLFLLFRYTRNGLLFAPLFFVLGGLLARTPAPGGMDSPPSVSSCPWASWPGRRF